jgi:hypothetical protein
MKNLNAEDLQCVKNLGEGLGFARGQTTNGNIVEGQIRRIFGTKGNARGAWITLKTCVSLRLESIPKNFQK